MRQANIFYKTILAGILTETNDGEYVFKYDYSFIKQDRKYFITLTMPGSSTEYADKRLFPFFEGLIPEGWLLDVAVKNWKLNPNDRMGLLLSCCQNCIGAVSVVPINTDSYE